MKRTIIVSNRTGGQGKTLTASMIALGHQLGGETLGLVAVDTVNEGATSKLGKLHSDVLEFRIGAGLADIKKNSAAALAHWDKLGALLLQGGVLLDLGANVVHALWEWAAARNASQVFVRRAAPPICLVVPARAQSQAIEDAVTLLRLSFDDEHILPIAERVLILNEAGGGFEKFGTNEDFKTLHAMKKKGLKIIRMPRCTSEIWAQTERLNIGLAEAIQFAPEVIEERFGLDPFAASGALADLLGWTKESLDELARAGLVPHIVEAQ
ncbi:MAG: hypothetical protein HQL38_15795 [Alphaproteobacteria bacterium]|nr:hypothetical protein [Alphaproteobacteria bacterium]